MQRWDCGGEVGVESCGEGGGGVRCEEVGVFCVNPLKCLSLATSVTLTFSWKICS